jgi:hypothetical protein
MCFDIGRNVDAAPRAPHPPARASRCAPRWGACEWPMDRPFARCGGRGASPAHPRPCQLSVGVPHYVAYSQPARTKTVKSWPKSWVAVYGTMGSKTRLDYGPTLAIWA